MEILVQNKCNVDARDVDLMTPLMYAALNGQPRVMRNLLEKNVHLDAKDKDGWNALHWAAKMADRETCSDGSGLGLRPKPARPRGFLGGPSPPEARSSKPESPAGFFGPKIGQFWSRFWTEFW